MAICIVVVVKQILKRIPGKVRLGDKTAKYLDKKIEEFTKNLLESVVQETLIRGKKTITPEYINVVLNKPDIGLIICPTGKDDPEPEVNAVINTV